MSSSKHPGLPLASSTWDHEDLTAAKRVLDSGNLTMGKEVASFEQAFADFVGSRYAVMFNSGSSANLGMLFSLKYVRGTRLREKSEVIVPAVSWSTTFFPVTQAGFKLRFVDIRRDTLNIDVEKVLENITDKTGAILAVNLLGNPAELKTLQEIADDNGLILIEDNCEALGAIFDGKQAGTFGTAGTFSFYFSHHICTMEGGMVVTDSKELEEVLRSIRAHGWTRELKKDNSIYPLSSVPWEDLFRFVLPGFNLRPLEISGAVGKTQLSKLPEIVSNRRANAKEFQSLFSHDPHFDIQLENGESSWFGFSLILKNALEGKRTPLVEFLGNFGVETRPIVAGNFLRNPVMKHLDFVAEGSFSNADAVHDLGFFVGNSHNNIIKELKDLRELINQFVDKVA